MIKNFIVYTSACLHLFLFTGCFDDDRFEYMFRNDRIQNELSCAAFAQGYTSSGYISFRIKFKNLSNIDHAVIVQSGRLISPEERVYKMLSQNESIYVHAEARFSNTLKSKYNRREIITADEKFIKKNYLKSFVLNSGETAVRFFEFPLPQELQDSFNQSYKGIYHIKLIGEIQGKGKLAFPRLSWNAGNSLIKQQYEKQKEIEEIFGD